MVTSLLSMRDDITCAVSTSGVIAVALRMQIRGWPKDSTGYSDFFDPIDHIGEISKDPDLRILIVSDPQDIIVPFQTQSAYVEAAKVAGLNATLLRATATGDAHHGLGQTGIKVVKWCLDGVSSEEMQKRLPIPKGS